MREISVDLPAFGIADEPDVGEQLQVQPQRRAPRRAGPAATCAARGWWSGEVRVAKPAACRPARRARAARLRRGRRPASDVLAVGSSDPSRRRACRSAPRARGRVRWRRCGSSPRRARRARRRAPDGTGSRSSVLRCGLATRYTDPPLPPSPPSGPPRGTNFSRRKLMAPRPPWPAATWMSTSSTNMAWQCGVWRVRRLDVTRFSGSARPLRDRHRLIRPVSATTRPGAR